MQVNALLHHVMVHDGSHGIVYRSHHLTAHLHHVHFQSLTVQVLGHLQTDESAAYNYGTARTVGGDIVLDGIGIGHIAQCEDVRQIDALEVRTDRGRSGRKHQFVIALGVLGTGFQILDAHGFLLAQNLHSLLTHTDVYRKTVLKPFHRLHKKMIAL